MSWLVNSVTIQKLTDYTGEASVKLVDEEDDKFILFINKLIIDIQSGVNSVNIVKFQGVQVVSGPVIDDLKKIIMMIFQEGLNEYSEGLYEISYDGKIEKLV
jgi:hypothetical protein